MAIQVSLSDSQTTVGIACAQAYARIVGVHYEALTGRLDLAVNVYATRAARIAGKAPVFGGVYTAAFTGITDFTAEKSAGLPDPAVQPAVQGLPVVSGFNFPAFYSFLKTIPDFSAGTDV